MGTEVHCKSYLPGYHSMGDINEDSNSSSWPLFYGEKTLTNGQYYTGFMPRTVTDAYLGYDKDVLKQKMLEHEAIFRNQVYELHRVYRIQRDMMEEVHRRELHNHHISIDTSSSSSFLPSQMPSEDARKWHIPSFPISTPGCARSSMLGAEIINSPLSCTKGNSTQAGRVSSQNRCTSEDCEVLESRPSKVRKKLFDLQLPADEYIDSEEGEQFHDDKICDISSYPSNGNKRIAPERSVKLFLDGGGKTDGQGYTSTSDLCLRRAIGLADLNEPIQVEAATAPTSIDFLDRSACHGEIRGLDLSAKPKSQFQGLAQELVQNFQHGSNSVNLNNLSVESKGNRKEWLSFMYEAGNSKSNPNSIPQLQPDKLPIPSHPTQLMLNKAHQPLGIHPTDHSRGNLWRERTVHGIEISGRSHDPCNYNHPEPVGASRISSPHQFVNSSDLTNSWSHSITSWGKPTNSLTQKLTSVQAHPFFNSSATFSRNSQSSDQSHKIFGDKWLVNGRSRLNPCLACELPTRNGFYHASSSGSKEQSVCFPSISLDYLNCNKGDNVSSECVMNHGSEKFFKGSNFVDLKAAKDMNLNVVPNDSYEAVSQQDLEIIDAKGNCQDHLAALPWLRAKPSCKNEATGTKRDSNSVVLGFCQSSSNQMCKNETVRDPNHIFTPNIASASSNRDIGAKKEIGDCEGKRKILGVPIFENPCTSRNDSSSLVSTSASLYCRTEGKDIKNEGKYTIIDINMACDPTVPESIEEIVAEALVVKEGILDMKVTNFRNHIDLNSCMSEDEDPLPLSVASTSASVKIAVEIDLEAPLVPETEEAILLGEDHKQHEAPLQSPQHKAELPDDEFVRIAAEAIVAISSSDQNNMEDNTCHPSEASLVDPLLWFVEVVSSCTDIFDSKLGKEARGRDGGDIEEISSNDLDYFEVMTLQLNETKEEDYMPKPLVPEIRELEETGATSLPNRARKSQPRRGRQRRDFQRDILPGLASLSRHEVTEDLQIFGGLMRATGHPWNSGLTRRNGTRNGAARGRRRSVVDPEIPIYTPLMQQLANIEVGLEWGKTTRRPRRQRCAAGNPPAAILLA